MVQETVPGVEQVFPVVTAAQGTCHFFRFIRFAIIHQKLTHVFMMNQQATSTDCPREIYFKEVDYI
jgi:hypothetical protein